MQDEQGTKINFELTITSNYDDESMESHTVWDLQGMNVYWQCELDSSGEQQPGIWSSVMSENSILFAHTHTSLYFLYLLAKAAGSSGSVLDQVPFTFLIPTYTNI